MISTDNNGEIDIEEMANIIETLDCIEGVQAGAVRYDENGHPVDTPSPKTRAEDLFLVFPPFCTFYFTILILGNR